MLTGQTHKFWHFLLLYSHQIVHESWLTRIVCTNMPMKFMNWYCCYWSGNPLVLIKLSTYKCLGVFEELFLATMMAYGPFITPVMYNGCCGNGFSSVSVFPVFSSGVIIPRHLSSAFFYYRAGITLYQKSGWRESTPVVAILEILYLL